MTTQTKGYKDLIVWQKAMDLVPAVYKLARRLPREETYGLTSQIRRAAVSIPANIAEGQARRHRAEFSQHLGIARGSLAELDTLMILAVKLGYLSEADVELLGSAMIEIRRLLQGLIQSLDKQAIH